ncbi:MAG: DUF6291 domain-containing protein, partial [Oscillospiraceae bacterium]|nr:DUF6291 domain-containing protein [Oscillospiraceae bacterium]
MQKRTGETNSFLIYADYLESFELMEPVDVKALLMTMFRYVSGEWEAGRELAGQARMAWTFIRSQLDRDKEKYRDRCRRNRENGLKGGRPRLQEEPEALSAMLPAEETPAVFSAETEKNRTVFKKPDDDAAAEKGAAAEKEAEADAEKDAAAENDADAVNADAETAADAEDALPEWIEEVERFHDEQERRWNAPLRSSLPPRAASGAEKEASLQNEAAPAQTAPHGREGGILSSSPQGCSAQTGLSSSLPPRAASANAKDFSSLQSESAGQEPAARQTGMQPAPAMQTGASISQTAAPDMRAGASFMQAGVPFKKTPAPVMQTGAPNSAANPSCFTPPSLQQVEDYCRQRSSVIDPQRFVDYYEANGWMRG